MDNHADSFRFHCFSLRCLRQISEKSNKLIQQVRFFLCNDFGTYYLAIGLFFFIVSLYIAFSDYGKIVLGQKTNNPSTNFGHGARCCLLAGLLRIFCFTLFQSGSLMHLTPHQRNGSHPGMGRRLSIVSLGIYSLEFLFGFGRFIWLYASRQKKAESKILRSMSAAVEK